MKNEKRYIYSNNKNKHAKPFKHPSYFLTEKQVTDIANVINAAHDRGIEINRFWTIHLQGSAYEADPQKLLNKTMKNSREWLRRRGIEHVYVWTLEKGTQKGIHAHIMMHVPRGYQVEFKRALYAWTGLEKERFVHKEIIYPPWLCSNYYNRVHGVKKYISKGVFKTGKHANKQIDEIISSYQGSIIGRRCGMSKVSKVY